MLTRRLIGLIALGIFAVLAAYFAYRDSFAAADGAIVAFAPAVSTDESVPVPDEILLPPPALLGLPAQAAPDGGTTDPAVDPTVVAAIAPAAVPAPALPEAPVEASPNLLPPAFDPIFGAPEATVGDGWREVTAAEPAAPSGPPPAPGEAAQPGNAPALPQTVPEFDIVRVEPTGEVVIAGVADPGVSIALLDGAEVVGTAQANIRGEFAMVLDHPLAVGTHDLAIRTTSEDGVVAILSDQRVAVSIPETASDDVLVVLNAPGSPSRVLQLPSETPAPPDAAVDVAAATPAPAPAVAEPNPPPPGLTLPPAAVTAAPQAAAAPPASPPTQGMAPTDIAPGPPSVPEPPETLPGAEVAALAPGQDGPAAAVAEPDALPAPPAGQPGSVAVSAVEADPAGRVYVAGTATSESVRVYLDGKWIGDAYPSPSGTWLVETERDIPAGRYQVRADLVTPTGAVVARAEVDFERQTDVAALTPAGTLNEAEGSGEQPKFRTVIIKRGDNLWTIARQTWGDGVRWSTIYEANMDQIRNPHWIYPGQVFLVPAEGPAAAAP